MTAKRGRGTIAALYTAIVLVVIIIVMYVARWRNRLRPCVTDLDCGSGEYCVAGTCGPCVSDSSCGPGEYCISGTCGPCTAGSQCPKGEGCANGACGPCSSGADCRTGEGCVRGVCGACESTSDCTPGESCRTAGWGMVCAPCQTDFNCRSDYYDAYSEQVCVAGKCVDCGPEAPCSDGLVCGDGGCQYCQPGGCPAGQVCDPTSRRCGSCGQNSDCAHGEACAGGTCGPCASATQCDPGEGCADGVCGPCSADADCPKGYTCSGPGTGSAECVLGGSCQTVEDCSPTQDCVEGSCQDPAPCASDADCGEGKICFSKPGWEGGGNNTCRTSCVLATLRSSDCGLRGNPPSCAGDDDCHGAGTWCDPNTKTCTCYDWATISCGQDEPLDPYAARGIGPKISEACAGAAAGDPCSIEADGNTYYGHCGWWTSGDSCESPSDCPVGDVCQNGTCSCGGGGSAPSNLTCYPKHICTTSVETSATNPVGGCVRTAQTCFGD